MLDVHPDAELAPRDVVARGDRRSDGGAGRPPVLPRRHALGARLPGPALPDHRRAARAAGLRLGAAADPGDAGRALLDGRRRDRHRRAHHPARALRRRRGRLHGRARRQPAGVELAAGGRRLRRTARRARSTIRRPAPGRSGARRWRATGRRRPRSTTSRRDDRSTGAALQQLHVGGRRPPPRRRRLDARGRRARQLAAPDAATPSGEDANLLALARASSTPRSRGEESRGAHFRSDFPPQPTPPHAATPTGHPSRDSRCRCMLTTPDRPRRRPGRPRRGRALGRHHRARLLIPQAATATADLVAREPGTFSGGDVFAAAMTPDRPRHRRCTARGRRRRRVRGRGRARDGRPARRARCCRPSASR